MKVFASLTGVLFGVLLAMVASVQAAESNPKLVSLTQPAPAAASTTPVEVGRVSTTAQIVAPTSRPLSDTLFLNYFGVYHGAQLNHFSSSHSVDRNGNESSGAINFDSVATAAYMFDKNIGLGLDIPFIVFPVLGQGVVLGDVGLKLFDRATISHKGFIFSSTVILQAPTSDHSQHLEQYLGLKFTPFVRYSIPSSRFTVGAWTEEKWYLGANAGKDFKVFAAPYVNYRLTSSLSFNLLYAFEAHHDIGTPGMLNFRMHQMDIEPGIVWMVNHRVMVNPYVQFFTTNELSAEHAALGATISATLL